MQEINTQKFENFEISLLKDSKQCENILKLNRITIFKQIKLFPNLISNEVKLFLAYAFKRSKSQ